MGDQFLNDLAKGFEDGVVVDAGQMEGDGSIFVSLVREFILDALHDLALRVELEIVREAVNFVDEDLDVDAGKVLLKMQNRTVEVLNGIEIFVLGVNDIDERTNGAKDALDVKIRSRKIDLSRKVPDLEIHKGALMIASTRQRRHLETPITYCIASLVMRAVDSRKSVSVGGILWKTTLEMEDLPDLGGCTQIQSLSKGSIENIHLLAHEQQPRLLVVPSVWQSARGKLLSFRHCAAAIG